MSKFYKIESDWDIGNEDTPYMLYIQTDNKLKIDKYLENYCCSVGEDYEEAIEEGFFTITEVDISDIVKVL